MSPIPPRFPSSSLSRYIHNSYVNTAVCCIVLLALDFWTVKNVTGRLLVGLRWWNNIQEDGSSQWVFESHLDETNLDTIDREVFWKTTYVWCALWVVLFVINLFSFSFDWLLLICIALGFSCSNLVGYWKCSKDAKSRMLAAFQNSMAQTIAVNSIFGAAPESGNRSTSVPPGFQPGSVATGTPMVSMAAPKTSV